MLFGTVLFSTLLFSTVLFSSVPIAQCKYVVLAQIAICRTIRAFCAIFLSTICVCAIFYAFSISERNWEWSTHDLVCQDLIIVITDKGIPGDSERQCCLYTFIFATIKDSKRNNTVFNPEMVINIYAKQTSTLKLGLISMLLFSQIFCFQFLYFSPEVFSVKNLAQDSLDTLLLSTPTHPARLYWKGFFK